MILCPDFIQHRCLAYICRLEGKMIASLKEDFNYGARDFKPPIASCAKIRRQWESIPPCSHFPKAKGVVLHIHLLYTSHCILVHIHIIQGWLMRPHYLGSGGIGRNSLGIR